MSLDEFISIVALMLYTGSITLLTVMTFHQAHDRWGMPFPRFGPISLIVQRWIRHQPGTNGRWKLDWCVTAFLAILVLRNIFTIKYLIQHGRPEVNWTFTSLYLVNAIIAMLLMRYIRIENTHRKEEEHE